MKSFIKIFSNCPVPVILPLHPRTVKLAKRFGLENKLLDDPNINVIDPVGYFDFLVLMKHSRFILTDSGGIQEEAPALGKPVLVMRTETERPKGVDAGTARLVGTDVDCIVAETERLLNERDTYYRMARSVNPYGDGRAAERIANVISSLS